MAVNEFQLLNLLLLFGVKIAFVQALRVSELNTKIEDQEREKREGASNNVSSHKISCFIKINNKINFE